MRTVVFFRISQGLLTNRHLKDPFVWEVTNESCQKNTKQPGPAGVRLPAADGGVHRLSGPVPLGVYPVDPSGARGAVFRHGNAQHRRHDGADAAGGPGTCLHRQGRDRPIPDRDRDLRRAALRRVLLFQFSGAPWVPVYAIPRQRMRHPHLLLLRHPDVRGPAAAVLFPRAEAQAD